MIYSICMYVYSLCMQTSCAVRPDCDMIITTNRLALKLGKIYPHLQLLSLFRVPVIRTF